MLTNVPIVSNSIYILEFLLLFLQLPFLTLAGYIYVVPQQGGSLLYYLNKTKLTMIQFEMSIPRSPYNDLNRDFRSSRNSLVPSSTIYRLDLSSRSVPLPGTFCTHYAFGLYFLFTKFALRACAHEDTVKRLQNMSLQHKTGRAQLRFIRPSVECCDGFALSIQTSCVQTSCVQTFTDRLGCDLRQSTWPITSQTYCSIDRFPIYR